MASLKEIKGRISSIKSTLKITSAMKLVASAKFRKAQALAEGMVPYEATLRDILAAAVASYVGTAGNLPLSPVRKGQCDGNDGAIGNLPLSPVRKGQCRSGQIADGAINDDEGQCRSGRIVDGEAGSKTYGEAGAGRVAMIAVSSNTSMCGGFNANVVREALAAAGDYGCADVFPVGKKMYEAFRKAGYGNLEDLSGLSAAPSYAQAAKLADKVMDRFDEGEYSKVVLVYTHFVSTSSQKVVRETFLPMDAAALASVDDGKVDVPARQYIIEPSAEDLLEDLKPKVLKLKIYSMLLDSAAAEHAARMMAMQMATDNGEDILQELTLEYNKGRQQKITSELLDIVGGSAAE